MESRLIPSIVFENECAACGGMVEKMVGCSMKQLGAVSHLRGAQKAVVHPF
jgi:hypothetical protein